ncbi:MAG: DUF4339 domain-containing protein [Planctomycetia bacterium]|nr:DUF4339 domain-containing protein [Planctomycetia bacterium]
MWYYELNRQQCGPVSEEEVKSLLARNILSPQSLVWRQGMQDWAPAHSIPAFMQAYQGGAAAPVGTPPFGAQPFGAQPSATQQLGGRVPTVGDHIPGYQQPSPEQLRSWFRWMIICTIVGALTCIILIGIPILIVGMVCMCKLMYHLWAAMPQRETQTSPGCAVLYFFIPFFNIVWSFMFWLAIVKNNENMLKMIGRPPLVKSEHALIVLVLMLIPYANLIAGIYWYFVMNNIKEDAIVAMGVNARR